MDAVRFDYGPLIRRRDGAEASADGTPMLAPDGEERDGRASSNAPRRKERKSNEMRSLFQRVGVITQAAGSAYIEVGNTKVMCSVYGPSTPMGGSAEVNESAKVVCDLRWSQFARERRSADMHRTDEESDLGGAVARCLQSVLRAELYPKTRIEVNVLILEDDGSAFATSMSCAALALASAGVEMTDVLAACSVALIDDETRLDPSAAEEAAASGMVTVTYSPSAAAIMDLMQTGGMPLELADAAIKTAIAGAAQVVKLLRAYLVSHERKLRKALDDSWR